MSIVIRNGFLWSCILFSIDFFKINRHFVNVEYKYLRYRFMRTSSFQSLVYSPWECTVTHFKLCLACLSTRVPWAIAARVRMKQIVIPGLADWHHLCMLPTFLQQQMFLQRSGYHISPYICSVNVNCGKYELEVRPRNKSWEICSFEGIFFFLNLE